MVSVSCQGIASRENTIIQCGVKIYLCGCGSFPVMANGVNRQVRTSVENYNFSE